MNKFKKIFTLILCFAMIASVSTVSIGQLTAFADDATVIEFRPGNQDSTQDNYLESFDGTYMSTTSEGYLVINSTVGRGRLKWHITAPKAGSYKVYFDFENGNAGNTIFPTKFTIDDTVNYGTKTGTFRYYDSALCTYGNNEYTEELNLGRVEPGRLSATNVEAGRMNLEKGENIVVYKSTAVGMTITKLKLVLDVEYKTNEDGTLADKFLGYRTAIKTEGVEAADDSDNAYKYYKAWAQAKATGNGKTLAQIGISDTKGYSNVAGYKIEDWMTDPTAQGNDPDGNNPEGKAYSKMFADKTNNALSQPASYDEGMTGDIYNRGYSFLKYEVTITEEEAGFYDMDAAMRNGQRMKVTHMETGDSYVSDSAAVTGVADYGSRSALAKVFDSVFLEAGTHTFKVECGTPSYDSVLQYRYLRLTKTVLPIIGGASVEFIAKDVLDTAEHTIVGTGSDIVEWTKGEKTNLNVEVADAGAYKVSVKAMSTEDHTVSGYLWNTTDADTSSENKQSNSLVSNLAIGNLATGSDITTVKTAEYQNFGVVYLTPGVKIFEIAFTDANNTSEIGLYSIKFEKVSDYKDTYYILAKNFKTKTDADPMTPLEASYGDAMFLRQNDNLTYDITLPAEKGGKYKVTVNAGASDAEVFTLTSGESSPAESSVTGTTSNTGAPQKLAPCLATGELDLLGGENTIKINAVDTLDACVGFNFIKLELSEGFAGDCIEAFETVTDDEFNTVYARYKDGLRVLDVATITELPSKLSGLGKYFVYMRDFYISESYQDNEFDEMGDIYSCIKGALILQAIDEGDKTHLDTVLGKYKSELTGLFDEFLEDGFDTEKFLNYYADLEEADATTDEFYENICYGVIFSKIEGCNSETLVDVLEEKNGFLEINTTYLTDNSVTYEEIVSELKKLGDPTIHGTGLGDKINDIAIQIVQNRPGEDDSYTPITPTRPSPIGSVGSFGSDNTKTDEVVTDTPVIDEEIMKENPYIDTDSCLWAIPSIVTLQKVGVLSVDETKMFRPNDLVKREEFTKMVIVAFKLSKTDSGISFNDTNLSDWHYPYIEVAYNTGLITGVSENEFGVGRYISREDMAVIINRLLKSNSKTSNDVNFVDYESISDYAKDAVNKISSAGIITGFEDGSFKPKESLTRAQAAVVINRLLEKEA